MNRNKLQIIANEYNEYAKSIGYYRKVNNTEQFGRAWQSCESSTTAIYVLIMHLGIADCFDKVYTESTLAGTTFNWWKMVVKD